MTYLPAPPDPGLVVHCSCGWTGRIADTDAPLNSVVVCPDCRRQVEVVRPDHRLDRALDIGALVSLFALALGLAWLLHPAWLLITIGLAGLAAALWRARKWVS